MNDSKPVPARHAPETREVRTGPFVIVLLIGLFLMVTGFAADRLLREKSGGIVAVATNLFRNVFRTWKAHEASDYRASLEPPVRATAALPVFDDGVKPGWQNWSWAKHNAKSHVPGETKALLLLHPANYEGLYFKCDTRESGGYGALEIEFRPAQATDDPKAIALNAALALADGKFGPQVPIVKHLVSEARTGQWRVARVPLKELLGDTGTLFSGVVVMAGVRETLPDVYIRRIALAPDTSLPAASTEETVAVTVDTQADRHEISPYIYGIAFGTPEEFRGLHPSLRRWGGNPNTRYNWLTNAWNSARDWNFQGYGDDPAKPTEPGKAAVEFVTDTAKEGASILFTIPTIGWVTKDGDKTAASKGVPDRGGVPLRGADGPITGYDPTANRRLTSVRSVARKGKPFAYPPEPQPAKPGPEFTVAQDEFVHFLTKRFGRAADGGVRFYAMDNEADLWAFTHTDIKPALLGYDDLFANFREYASAIKDVDPTAMITGPVSWGWTGFQYSPLDKGTDNYRTHADRKAHGDVPFLVWFLRKAQEEEKRTGRRILDVLDVHYYPQGDVYNGKTDETTAARRIRSVRSLFDPKYADESWIGEPVRLLPRLKEWVGEGYPGTKIGLTEWNFGGESHISGALAIAEALSVFGREDLYLASYWTAPKANSPAYMAFQLITNPEGDGKRGVESVSCRAVSESDGRLSVYATTDQEGRKLSLVVINKTKKILRAPIRFSAGTAPATATATMHQLTADATGMKAKIVRSERAIDPRQGISLVTPPYSVTLIRLPLVSGGEGK